MPATHPTDLGIRNSESDQPPRLSVILSEAARRPSRRIPRSLRTSWLRRFPEKGGDPSIRTLRLLTRDDRFSAADALPYLTTQSQKGYLHVIPTERAKRTSGGIHGFGAEAVRLIIPQIPPLGPLGSSVGMTSFAESKWREVGNSDLGSSHSLGRPRSPRGSGENS